MPHVEVNGARLWYEVTGQGEPVLLHHGYTASRANWMPVAERLKDEYQIILMECRGTGESEDTSDGYNIPQYGEDVIGLLDHLGLTKVTFAGHSMGGGIGYYLAVKHADRLDKLVLMAPIPASGISTPPDPEALAVRQAARDRGDRDFFLQEMINSRFREDVQTDAWFNLRVDHLLRVSEGHVRGGAQSMRDIDFGKDLAAIHTPTLMLAGCVDGLLPFNLDDYSKLPNACLHVLSRAGHDVAIHEPDATSEAIRDFLKHGPLNAQLLALRIAERSKVL